MIEEQIPLSFLDNMIDVMEKELEYELYEDDDRKKCSTLAYKVDALKELRRRWLDERKRYR